MEAATELLAQEFAQDKIMNKKAGDVETKLTKTEAKCSNSKPKPNTGKIK